MKKTALLLIATLAISGCVTRRVYESPVQHYRPAGAEQPITITGRMLQENQFTTKTGLEVKFNETVVLRGFMPPNMTRDVTGDEYEGRIVSASCSSRQVTRSWIDVRCIIFHGNERVATLSF